MKKRKAKKSALALLTLVLALGFVLSACSSEKSTNEPKESNAATPATEEAELEPYEVSLIFPGDTQADEKLVEEEINAYLKDKINATVDIQQIGWGEYTQKTELMMQSGEKMDLIFAPSWYGFFKNVDKGAFLPLNDDSAEWGNLMEKYGKGIKDSIHPLFLEAPVVKGQLYAIPTNKEIAQGSAYFFRKDIVEKYNIPYQDIKVPADMTPYLDIIKQKEPNISPAFATLGKGFEFRNEAVLLNGYRPFEVTNTYINHTSGEFKVYPIYDPVIWEPFLAKEKVYHEWWEKGYINKDANTTQVDIMEIRRAGKDWWEPNVYKPAAESEKTVKNESGAGPENFEFVMSVTSPPLVTTGDATGSQLAISATSEDPARAMMLLNLMHTDKTLINLMVRGIEGKHYEKVEENRIKLIPNSGFDPGNAWQLGNQTLNYLVNDEPADKYEQYVKFNEEAQRSDLLGFVFDPSPIQAEIGLISNIDKKFERATIGQDPEFIWQKKFEELKAAGLDKVVAELQKQLDAWLESIGKK